MAATKRGTRRGSFHALENRIHELEKADREQERKRDQRASTTPEKEEPTSVIATPSAHDE